MLFSLAKHIPWALKLASEYSYNLPPSFKISYRSPMNIMLDFNLLLPRVELLLSARKIAS